LFLLFHSLAFLFLLLHLLLNFISGFYPHSKQAFGLGACWDPILMKGAAI